MPKTARTVSAMLVGALAAAGCASSSSSSTPSQTTGSAQATSASTSSSAPAPPKPALITTKRDKKLGMILAYGPKRLTVYLFEADKGKNSTCTGACAKVWPPLTGTPTAHGAAMNAVLGTTTRPDGRMQVTYKGHPLYLFVKDKDDEDAYGEGLKSFGADWYGLSPSGKKVDLS